MEIEQKFGDTRKVAWRVSTSLTDAVIVLKVENAAGTPVTVDPDDVTVPDPPSGIVFWQMTGTLPVGSYAVNLKITRDGEIMTAPTIGHRTLTITEALG